MENQEKLRCIGCGAIIQSKDPQLLGYVPQKTLDKEGITVYCQRCFRLRHYNEIAPAPLTNDDFRRILMDIADKDALVVNVIDIFDVSGSMIPGLSRYVGKNNLFLVANKRDILPKSVNDVRLTDWLKKQAKANGIKPKDILVMSANREYDVYTLLELIETYRHGRDVYIVGVTNVGKSTLVNAMIKHQLGLSDVVTTSRFPGTTLDRIEIPLDDECVLIDTPGIILKGQMAHHLNPEDLKFVSPKKEIKPKTFQLNSGQTLFIGGLARFDLIKSSKQGLTTYFDNELDIHRTKLENADEFFERHAGEILKPTAKGRLVRKEFSVKDKSDLVISGLGWVCVPEKATVAVWAPEGVDVLIRKALI
ncbi:MAG: ribosome biogenesis GTPase YqeH [Streptococcaceae bacterium]|jgi:ribosome biogenesis GTPase YqeH|nr:ribosome biogenesis GTPase YqeH [Streptococcaceae bacterium]